MTTYLSAATGVCIRFFQLKQASIAGFGDNYDGQLITVKKTQGASARNVSNKQFIDF